MSDPKAITISNLNFYSNRRQMFFPDPKGVPFYVKTFFVQNGGAAFEVFERGWGRLSTLFPRVGPPLKSLERGGAAYVLYFQGWGRLRYH